MDSLLCLRVDVAAIGTAVPVKLLGNPWDQPNYLIRLGTCQTAWILFRQLKFYNY